MKFTNMKFISLFESITPEMVRYHSELERKHLDGTITPEEMEKAQALVGEAAKAAGYDTKVYRGHDPAHHPLEATATRDTATWTTEKEVAKDYDENVTEALVQTDKLFDFSGTIKFTKRSAMQFLEKLGTKDAEKRLASMEWEDNGNLVDYEDASASAIIMAWEFADSSWFKSAVIDAGYNGIRYTGDHEFGRITDEIRVFSPNQIKSADPFTGVSLDKRFNSGSNDIRESK